MAASFDRDFVQRVRDAVDVVTIAEDHTRLEQKGKRWMGLCPFHKEKSPSFSVDPDQGLYYCFGCGAGGDAIRLHMEQTGDAFPEAIEALARRFGVPLPRGGFGRTPDAGAGPDVKRALAAAQVFFRRALGRHDKPRAYLKKRRMPPAVVERYGLGYAPDDWHALHQALGRELSEAELVAAGLLGRSQKSGRLYDRFRDRLMFPIKSPSGRLVGFGGRTLGDDRAKYVNTAETPAFQKRELLYGLDQAKKAMRERGRAVLTEGYFDVLGAVACGLEESVANMGTSLTEAQAKLLARYAEEVVLAYDGDDAGEAACERALPLLLAAGLGVKRARLPAGHDPDSLRLEVGPEAVAELVDAAEDALWLVIRRRLPVPGSHPSPAETARAADRVVELLRPIGDRLTRYGYARRAAQALGVPEDLLFGRLGGRGARYAPELAGDAAPRARRRPPELRSEEERALALLLHALEHGEAAQIQDLDGGLPPAEIFFDPDARNIYRAFIACKSEADPLPSLARVRETLDAGSEALDLMARLLLEETVPDEGRLGEALDRLRRRWHKQRQPELMRQIRRAQEDGDTTRLAELLEEKAALTRSIHPETTGNLW